MKIADAHKLLVENLEQHGLSEQGWQPKMDNAKRRFGFCDIGRKIISLSRPLSEVNPEDEVLDTILHEIAHALAFLEHGEDCGHDERWKSVCRRIGARPEACYDENDVIVPDALWVLVHSETDEVFESFQRKPNRDFSRVWIRGRKEETLGKLEIRPNQTGKIDSLSRPVVQHLSEEIMELLTAFAGEKGLTVERTNGSFTEHEYNINLTFRTEHPDGKTPEQDAFEKNAFLFNLTEDDYFRELRSMGKTYLLCGLKPNNRKYPIIGLCPRTGKRFKFPMDVLETLGGKIAN